jgi:hypothetical protein
MYTKLHKNLVEIVKEMLHIFLQAQHIILQDQLGREANPGFVV